MRYKCERCGRFMADLTGDFVCIGSFKPAVFAEIVPRPKESIMCSKCGYLNIFVERSTQKVFQDRGRRAS